MNRKSIKFLILLGLAVFSFSLIGCEKNHEKISKKLLKEKQEDRCLELIEAMIASGFSLILLISIILKYSLFLFK